MTGRITFRAGELEQEPADATLSPEALAVSASGGPEAQAEALRAACAAALARAAGDGARTVAIAPPVAGGLPLQRAAEALLEAARAQLAAGGPLAEIRFVLPDEPSLRVFESVQDAWKIAQQAQRWSR